MARGGMIFRENFKFQKKIHFVLLHSIFLCYYSSRNLKRQSEQSGLHPDTSNFVRFRFDYLKKYCLKFSINYTTTSDKLGQTESIKKNNLRSESENEF